MTVLAAAAAVRSGDLPGYGAHQRRRVRGAGTHRRRQARRRADDGRKAHAGTAAAPAGRVWRPAPRTGRLVSISQSTELGTAYTPAEIAALAEAAHEAGLLLHVDGARLLNAAEALGSTARAHHRLRRRRPRPLGGTKSGLLGAEAVVFFRPELAADYLYARKQGTQLASKCASSGPAAPPVGRRPRRETAGHANAMARRLADASPPFRASTSHPVQANAVFAALPAAATSGCTSSTISTSGTRDRRRRWMCSWQTTPGTSTTSPRGDPPGRGRPRLRGAWPPRRRSCSR